jgi:hypothetical protein
LLPFLSPFTEEVAGIGNQAAALFEIATKRSALPSGILRRSVTTALPKEKP